MQEVFPYKYHIFDMDGTLIDSMYCCVGRMEHVLEEDGIAYLSEELSEILMSRGSVGAAEYLLACGVNCKTPEEVMARMGLYEEYQYKNVIPLKNGVKEYLQELKRNAAQLYVLTASPHRLADACLKRHDVWNLFDRVWTLEDFVYNKADPRLFEEVARQIGGATHDMIVYDDNYRVLETAKKTGMGTVGVFDCFSERWVGSAKQGADQYVETFEVFQTKKEAVYE